MAEARRVSTVRICGSVAVLLGCHWARLVSVRIIARSLRQRTARSGNQRRRAAVRALLHAGTSCVDYSTLNNEKKTLHDGGESSQTFFGMFEWVKKATPTPRHSTA